MQKIKLSSGEWSFDESKPLGPPGGFGQVFRGEGPNGAVAVKRLLIRAQDAAHRELAIGQQLMTRKLAHVVPILDAGQDAESNRYFLVMPVCERSLHDEISKRGDTFDVDFFASAMSAIISGLEEVGDIAHRDLKPSNVLLHEGKWKIADFGIAKFVEDSTSLQTVRGALTPTYAAPEQWRGERASAATDIYALGCIAHTLSTGSPPFVGSVDQIREGHLHGTAPEIAVLPPRISALVTHMLRKPQPARPTLTRCKQILTIKELEKKEASKAFASMQKAAQFVATEEAKEEAARLAVEARQRERLQLFNDARDVLVAVRSNFLGKVEGLVENVKRNETQVHIGKALLEFDNIEGMPDFNDKRLHNWDIVAWSRISVTNGGSNRYSWSASLVYADLCDGIGYRWYEIGFFSLYGGYRSAPFALPPYDEDFQFAISTAMHTVGKAYGPYAVDGEDESSFAERWIALLALAATGQLQSPSQMPIHHWPGLS